MVTGSPTVSTINGIPTHEKLMRLLVARCSTDV